MFVSLKRRVKSRMQPSGDDSAYLGMTKIPPLRPSRRARSGSGFGLAVRSGASTAQVFAGARLLDGALQFLRIPESAPRRQRDGFWRGKAGGLPFDGRF